MKRIINIFLCAGIATMAAISCQKSIDDERPVTPPEKGDGHIEIRIGASLGEYSPSGATKAVLINTMKVSWEGGETVYVFDGTECLGSLKASLDGGDHGYALLSTDDTHTVDKPAGGTSVLTLVYSPALKETPEVEDGALTISLARQEGSSTSFVTYATLSYNGEESIVIENMVLPFKFATSVIRISCTGIDMPNKTKIRTAALSNVNTACKLSLSGTEAPAVAGTEQGKIIKFDDPDFENLNKGNMAFDMDVPVLDAATNARAVTLNQLYYDGYEDVFFMIGDNNFPQRELTAGTAFSAVCKLKNLNRPSGASPGLFTVGEDGRQVFFSSGNLFYTREYKVENTTYPAHWGIVANDFISNEKEYVGANYEEYLKDNYNRTQKLFGWGCTIPWETRYWPADPQRIQSGLPDYYLWPSERNPDDNSDPWGAKIDAEYGLPEGTWRTPTRDEWDYLCLPDNVGYPDFPKRPERKGKQKMSVITEYSTIPGLVIAPDDFPGEIKSEYSLSDWDDARRLYGLIFLPAAGHRYWSSWSTETLHCDKVIYFGEEGYYWSSTRVDDISWYKAWHLNFFKNEYGDTKSYCYYEDITTSHGCSVRLVSDVKY